MRSLTLTLTVVLAVLVGVLASPSSAAAQDEDGITSPDDLVMPANVPVDVLATYIIPLVPEIRPLVATIERPPEEGVRERTGGEETVISLNADVFFDFDSDVVKPKARLTLQDFVAQLAGLDRITVTGHTDSMGDEPYNLDLSRRRAESVAAVLAEFLPDLAITTDGRGETEPVAPNVTASGEDYPEGRALNRRVEIRYTP